MHTIEADYLVVAAGAMGMAFIDTLVSDETTWAFAPSSFVGCSTNSLVRALAVVVASRCRKLCCGLAADWPGAWPVRLAGRAIRKCGQVPQKCGRDSPCLGLRYATVIAVSHPPKPVRTTAVTLSQAGISALGETAISTPAVRQIDRFHLEPRCRICRNDQVRTRVNDLLASGASYAMVVRALGDDPVGVTSDSIRRHAERHFPVQNVARTTYREILEHRAKENSVDFVEGVATAITPMALLGDRDGEGVPGSGRSGYRGRCEDRHRRGLSTPRGYPYPGLGEVVEKMPVALRCRRQRRLELLHGRIGAGRCSRPYSPRSRRGHEEPIHRAAPTRV
jgi:hypothetical protein